MKTYSVLLNRLFFFFIGLSFFCNDAHSSEWVDSVLVTLSLEEKAGQLVLAELRPSKDQTVPVDTAWIDAESLVKEHQVGGFVLFGGSFPGVIEKLESLQASSSVPLLFAADFEKGAGQKITGTTKFPPVMALGAAGSEDLAYRVGLLTALQAVELGIGMTFSPVLDVNSNPLNPIINVRSFSEDPRAVFTLGQSYIRGCREGGLLTTAKHFPGHGDTEVDSHTNLPVINKGRPEFEQLELLPFRRVLESGVDAVMVGHLSVPALDSTGTPASLSGRIVNGILREEMGFQGLVVTDALVMDGVNIDQDRTSIYRKALSAGIDILLMPESVEDCVNAILDAVGTGEIEESTLNRHVRRVLEAKEKTVQARNLMRPESVEKRMTGLLLEGENTALELANKSITLLSNTGRPLPLDERSGNVFAVIMRGDSLLPEAAFFNRMMKKNLGERYDYVSLLSVPDSVTLEQVNRKAERADRVFVITVSQVRAFRGYPGLPPDMISLARDLLRNDLSVVVSLGNPYIIADFPDTPGIILAYGTERHSQKALAGAILGKTRVSGKLPVTIPGGFAIGSGIMLGGHKHGR